MYGAIVLFVISIFFYNKNEKLKEETISVHSDTFGDLEPTENLSDHMVDFSHALDLFKQYRPSIRISNQDDKKLNEYLEALSYVAKKQTEIEEKMKELFLFDNSKDEIEKQFNIEGISSTQYEYLKEYDQDNREQNLSITGGDELEVFVRNSRESDAILSIYAEFGHSSQANAYINNRTKEICYCRDDF